MMSFIVWPHQNIKSHSNKQLVCSSVFLYERNRLLRKFHIGIEHILVIVYIAQQYSILRNFFDFFNFKFYNFFERAGRLNSLNASIMSFADR